MTVLNTLAGLLLASASIVATPQETPEKGISGQSDFKLPEHNSSILWKAGRDPPPVMSGTCCERDTTKEKDELLFDNSQRLPGPPDQSYRKSMPEALPQDRLQSPGLEEMRLREYRQRKLDGFVDEHLGGLGKIEFQGDGYTGRFEYGYARSCGIKKLGICFRIRF